MPKGLNIKGFGRRKSSSNALEFETNTLSSPVTSSFRVLERPEKTSFHGSTPSFEKINRPFSSPDQQIRGKSAENIGVGQNRSVQSLRNRSDLRLSEYRGSSGTTNSGSSGHYDSSSASARHSSSSTPPSSIDHEGDPDDQELFPVKAKSNPITRNFNPMSRPGTGDVEPPVPIPPSFTARAARALSFGTRQRSSTIKDVPPIPPPHADSTSPNRSYSPQRERAATTSSYASTAVPPRTELSLDLGNEDFSGMFDGLKRPSPSPRQQNFHRTDSQPLFPPASQSRRNISPNPSPGEETPSPYSWDGDSPNQALMSSPMGSPNLNEPDQPMMPPGNSIAQNLLRSSSKAYSLVPDRYGSPRLESSSEDLAGAARRDDVAYPNRQNQLDDGDRWTRSAGSHDAQSYGSPQSIVGKDAPVTRQPTRTGRQRQTSRPSSANAPPPRKSSLTPREKDEFDNESINATPRATRYGLNTVGEDSMFDTSPIGPASRAIKPEPQPQHAHQSNGMKKMTKAQFQILQRRGDGSAEQSDEEEESGDEYDDGNDIERAKQMAKQRTKQEANMAVYRQQMKKVTGGGPTDLPNSSATRPSLDRSSMSAPAMSLASSLHFGGISGTPPADVAKSKPSDNEDDDDDVPLGILQAHGFPSNSRPPIRPADNEQQRRMSVTGSVVGGGAGQGNLPPFARRLPADPYFGASLVNHTQRESLAMNSVHQPTFAGPNLPPPQIVQPPPPPPQAPMGGHPGGLVGVIAGEERARAARRGSPNAATGFAPPASFPLPANLNSQMPGMPGMPGTQGVPPMTRAMSMGNLTAPQVYTPSGVPPMPMMMPPHLMSAMDPASQQMQQFMQMQMQLMQNMLQMQQAQLGQPTNPSGQPQRQSTFDYLGGGNGLVQRPVSQGSFMSSMQGLGQTPQGRSMTMLNPPTGWNAPLHANDPRHQSAMASTYAPTLDGPGPGYTPSIAPSERSNVGMPTRYRPVTSAESNSRTQSMTSSLTLQAHQPSRSSLAVPGVFPVENERPRSTIRIVDKLRGTPRTSPRPTEDDEDDGWAEMRKKREEKQKKSRLFKRKTDTATETPLSELYHNPE